MFEDLLPLYERELGYLKHEAAQFAKRYPALAGRLDLHEHDTENLDPHAERLIQAVALLAARVRLKLDDSFPELSDTLLELLFPHYLASTPSMTVVQFQLDPDSGQISTRHPVARGTELLSERIDGEACRFRTCYDVAVFPLEVAAVSLDSPARTLPRRGPTAGVLSALTIDLRATGAAVISELDLDRLRFHLDGLPEVSHGLHEMLLRHVVHVELSGTDAEGRETVVPLRARSLRPVGFDEDEGLLVYPRNSFLGFRLLQEYFALPEKFLFVDLDDLDGVGEAGFHKRMQIHVFFDTSPRFPQALDPSNLRLNCTPAVNLFRKQAEPINLDLRGGEVRVVPDARRRKTTETWMIEKVTGLRSDDSETVEVAPLFAFGHGARVEDSAMTWHPRRTVAADGAGEILLSIGLPERLGRTPLPRVLAVWAWCTNRDLPAELRFSVPLPTDSLPGTPRPLPQDERQRPSDFELDEMPGSLKIFGLRQPSPPRRLAPGRRAHWRLISHLALNHVSMLAGEGQALRGMLELYEPTNTRAARQQIAAIQKVTGSLSDRFLDGSLLRGMAVELLIDGGVFAGTGHYLFSTILERFLGSYASINSFTQLSVTNAADGEDRIVFPPRAGMQELA